LDSTHGVAATAVEPLSRRRLDALSWSDLDPPVVLSK
jgi:hypothetical protein